MRTHDDLARVATDAEIARMGDAEALARIDAMRERAAGLVASGDAEAACRLWEGACRIAEATYVGADVIGEYADALDAMGRPAEAQAWHARHAQVASMLELTGEPSGAYEDALRAEMSAGRAPEGMPPEVARLLAGADAAFYARPADGFPQGWEWRGQRGEPEESLHDAEGTMVATVDRWSSPAEYRIGEMTRTQVPVRGPDGRVACPEAQERAVDLAIARLLGVAGARGDGTPSRPRLSLVAGRARGAAATLSSRAPTAGAVRGHARAGRNAGMTIAREARK